MPDISFNGLLTVAVIAVTAPLLVNLSVGLDALLTRLQDTTADDPGERPFALENRNGGQDAVRALPAD